MKAKITTREVQPGRSPVYGKEISGRCRSCNIRYIWSRRLGLLKDMHCPRCGDGLALTTHQFKGLTLEIKEVI